MNSALHKTNVLLLNAAAMQPPEPAVDTQLRPTVQLIDNRSCTGCARVILQGVRHRHYALHRRYRLRPAQNVLFHVPNGLNGFPPTFRLTTTSLVLFPGPVVVSRRKKSRRK